jgi:16S rRNA processing protein RimM
MRDAGPADAAPDVELGVLRGAYGVKGWVRVQPHASDAEVLRLVRTWRLRDLNGARRDVAVLGLKSHPHGLVVQLDGITTPEAADALRGTAIEVSRAAFPALDDGQYYWFDLLGLQVVDRAGKSLGTVSGLQSNGVQELLEVGGLLIPMLPQYVDRIDVPGGRIEVDWDVEWS